MAPPARSGPLAGLLSLLIIVGLAAPALRAEFRTWTAATGGYTTEAELIELKDGTLVRLRMKNGTEWDFPLDKLSSADQEYVRKQSAGVTSPRLAKLDAEIIFAGIRAAVADGRAVDTLENGRGEEAFREVPPEGAALIGFDVIYGDYRGNPTIATLRPIFLSANGRKLGSFHGGHEGQFVRIEAKPGYAIGGLKIRAGVGIDSMSVVFMRIIASGLDPNDSYETQRYGGPGGTTQKPLAGDGSLVIGIFGTTPRDPTSTFNGLGLVTVPRKP